MNFALLSNNTIETFKTNVIGFPTTEDDQFVLTRENNNGSISYSWTKPVQALTKIDFITTNSSLSITTTPVKINIRGQIIVLDIYIKDIPKLCNMDDPVFIYVNGSPYNICKWVKFQQIIVDNDNKELEISSNVDDDIIALLYIHRA